MSFNGSGTYGLPSPPYPAVAGEIIKAADWNTILLDIANSLSLVLVRDGQAPMTGNLHMGTKRITNMADGITGTDAVAYGQVFTAAITALKVLTPAADQVPYFTSGSAAGLMASTSFGRGLLALANQAALLAAAGAEPADATILKSANIGSTVQGYDATLAALAALTVAANKLIYATGADAFSTTDLTAFARTLLDDTTAAAARTTLELDTISRRNRLCNGDFRVDNINAGAAVTPAASEYVVDNVLLNISQASKLTAQRIASSLTGFPYSEKFTVASAFTPGAGDFFNFSSGVEGLDIADLMMGTANAKAFTISFIVKVSAAGTYAFRLYSPAANRSYVWTQALSAGENTVTKTIAGDTTGAWAKDNTCAMVLAFDLGSGSTYQTATLNAWQTGNYISTTGVVSLVANTGATYEISGIQVEKGSFATPFEVLPYGQAEAWCQRYHPIIRGGTDLPAYHESTTITPFVVKLPVAARVAPTGVVIPALSNFSVVNFANSAGTPGSFSGIASASTQAVRLYVTTTAGSPTIAGGNSGNIRLGASGYIRFTGAEL